MNKKFKNSGNTGAWIGVGTAIGTAVFAATNEPVWIAVGDTPLQWSRTKQIIKKDKL